MASGTEAERALRRMAASGGRVDVSDLPEHERRIDAGLLADVVAGSAPGRGPARLELVGVGVVGGPLTLSHVVLPRLLSFESCTLGDVQLEDAEAGTLLFRRSTLGNVDADSLRAHQLSFALADVHGTIRLRAARIEDQLVASGAHVTGSDAWSLNCYGVDVGGSVVMWRFDGRDDGRRSAFSGRVDFSHATIGAGLGLHHARITPNEAMRVAQAAPSSTVDRQWGGVPLLLSHVRIGGSLGLNEVEIDGSVVVTAARIGSRCSLVGATVTGSAWLSVDLDRATVDGDVDLRRANLRGEVRLRNAHVGGAVEGTAVRIDLDEATLPPASEREPGWTPAAINAEGATIDGMFVLRAGARIDGGVRMPGVTIGHLFVADCTIARADIRVDALSLTHGRIGTLLKVTGPTFHGGVRLADVSVPTLMCRAGSWDTASYVELDGFTYTNLVSDPPGAHADVLFEQRMTLLRRTDNRPGVFLPGPYDQLAAFYRAHGEPDLATKTLIEREQDRTDALARRRGRARPGVLARRAFGLAVAHGFRPARAVILLAALTLALAALFRFGPAHTTALASTRTPPAARVEFNPVAYAADVVLPVVDLGETDGWRPSAAAPWGWLYRDAIWLSVSFGWILSTALVAAAARLARST